MNSSKKISLSYDYNGTSITLESGELAKQADGSVLARMGETVVLATAVVGGVRNVDYFPLQVIYEERLYAAGKIKGSRFIKREGRPSEDAVLTGRMIDRSLRSLFSGSIRNDIQVIVTILSVDEIHPPDTLSVLASSAALALATKEFKGPVSSVRVGLTPPQIAESLLQQFIAEIDASELLSDLYDSFDGIISYLLTEEDVVQKLFQHLGRKNPEWAAKLRLRSKNVKKALLSDVYGKSNAEPSLITMPSYGQMEESLLDLIVSGNGKNVMMIESGAQIVPEEIMAKALDSAMGALQGLTDFQTDFISQARSQGIGSLLDLEYSELAEEYKDYWNEYAHDIKTALTAMDEKDGKVARSKALKEVLSSHIDRLKEVDSEEVADIPSQLQSLYEVKGSWNFSSELEESFQKAVHSLVKEMALEGQRVDGRALDKTRDISASIDLLPKTHGSSLFNRGQTQVLNVLTLGTIRDAQTLDNMEDFEEGTKRYMHHYNFPSYSVGETGRYGAPSRREIGHGALAEKALLPVLPSEDEFPYTIRLVSECLGSNGSTSMASTCASTLSLMAGGVPLNDMVAGVAMGLVYDDVSDRYALLTDIQGFEDHYGDMDFKVTGTRDGITAIQLDNKAAGLGIHIIKEALVNSKNARLHILDIMEGVISHPRKDISEFAPGVVQITIPTEKIGDVIGQNGKIIKGIIEEFEVEIDIEDDGRVFIYGKDSVRSQGALQRISSLTKEYKKGDQVPAKVYRIEKYGAFARLEGGSKDGMIHISQMSDKRVEKVEDVLNMGQEVVVEVIEISEKGINLKLIQKS